MRADWNNWNLVGRWLGRRDIENEIGYPVYNAPGTIWEVEDYGFCSFVEGEIKYLYVMPEHRGTGLGRKLVLDAIGIEGKCRVRANKNSLHLFLTLGFQPVSSTKNFTLLRRQ